MSLTLFDLNHTLLFILSGLWQLELVKSHMSKYELDLQNTIWSLLVYVWTHLAWICGEYHEKFTVDDDRTIFLPFPAKIPTNGTLNRRQTDEKATENWRIIDEKRRQTGAAQKLYKSHKILHKFKAKLDQISFWQAPVFRSWFWKSQK